ncbi:MAG: hypothetical protein ACKPKO_20680 [Candidatus Fonsibacter sp.]
MLTLEESTKTDIYINIKILFPPVCIDTMHDPYHVHLDLDVTNNDYTHVGSPPYLRFEEIRNTQLLDGDRSEYFCNIVRFTVQTTNNLPLFIPVVEQ